MPTSSPRDVPHGPAPDLSTLAVTIGHRFVDAELLRQAMAHRSWCAESPGEESYERLEFLGDAVLGWVIADIAFHRFAHLAEGKLTDIRKSVVNEAALAEVAAEIGIGDHLLLGSGEAAAGGRTKPSILSDAFEALLGAVYLDGGAEPAYALVERWIAPLMSASGDRLDRFDHKTQLQELVARAGRGAPVYRVTSSGPDHAQLFSASVSVGGDVLGKGDGKTKKAAEQAAASIAVAALA